MAQQPPATPGPFGLSLEPRIARRIGWAVCILAGCGFLVAATIVVLELVRTRPLHGVTWLLFPGIPVLIVGQLWSVWILIGRVQPRMKRSWGPFRWSKITTRDFVGDLPRTARFVFMAIVVLLGVLGWVAGPPTDGGPAPPTRHCKYPLDNHGDVTCVDEGTYYRAGRDVQRFAASVLAAFFVFHLGISADELLRRRREED